MTFSFHIPAFVSRYKWRWTFGLLFLLFIGFLVAMATRPKQPEYVTAKAEQTDLEQTVEAVGTVTSEKDLGLQFRSSGIVEQIYVKEGQRVVAGQRLAALRSGTLAAGVASASAQVQEAEANLRAMNEGTRPEDIAVAEAQLANKRASLESAKSALRTAEDNLKLSESKLATLKAEANTTLGTQVSLTPGIVSQKLTAADQALSTIDSVFSNNDLQNAIVSGQTSQYDDMRASMLISRDYIAAARSSVAVSDYTSAIKALQALRTALVQTSSSLDRAYALITNAPLTSYYTSANQSTYQTQIATQRTGVQTAIRDTDTALQTLQQTPSGLETRISQEESNLSASKGARDKAQSDILTYQTSIQIDEANLQLKRAGARQTDKDAAAARVRQARANLARAAADWNDTVITAPVDGLITKVNVKRGELSPLEPAVTMVGDSPFRIEMYVSEIDIPKVKLTQSGSIELDAFRGTNYQLRVSEVDRAPTDRDGVSKYRIVLDFVYPHDEMKIGMTGDAKVITGFRQNVVSVPLRAVIENDKGASIVRVLKDDGTVDERDVTTGMEGGNGNVEVTGVGSGETIVVLVK